MESYISVVTIETDKYHTDFTTTAKYGAGVAGFNITEINTFLKLVNADFLLKLAH